MGRCVQDSSEELKVILEPLSGNILLLETQWKDSQDRWCRVFSAKAAGGLRGDWMEKTEGTQGCECWLRISGRCMKGAV